MRTHISLTCIVLGTWLVAVAAASTLADTRLDFDNNPGLPEGWHSDTTNPSGTVAVWRVDEDANALSPPRVLTLASVEHITPGVFNLFWTNRILFQNGELSVNVRANSGGIDQGGGLVWRVQDANNYYITRYNPLEGNFRLYYVKNGKRHQLASTGNLNIGRNVWFNIRVRHNGNRIQGWLNDKLAWDVTDDKLPATGGVGLWTKADAASSFDDLVVKPIQR